MYLCIVFLMCSLYRCVDLFSFSLVEQLHKLFCDLLKRLDDCQDDIRMETIDTFKSYVRYEVNQNTSVL